MSAAVSPLLAKFLRARQRWGRKLSDARRRWKARSYVADIDHQAIMKEPTRFAGMLAELRVKEAEYEMLKVHYAHLRQLYDALLARQIEADKLREKA